MLGIHVLFGFTREPIHVGPSPKKNKSSASRYEIPKTDPNFFAQTRFTSSKFTSGFRFFIFFDVNPADVNPVRKHSNPADFPFIERTHVKCKYVFHSPFV